MKIASDQRKKCVSQGLLFENACVFKVFLIFLRQNRKFSVFGGYLLTFLGIKRQRTTN